MIQGKRTAGMLLRNRFLLSSLRKKEKRFAEVFLTQVLLHIKRMPV